MLGVLHRIDDHSATSRPSRPHSSSNGVPFTRDAVTEIDRDPEIDLVFRLAGELSGAQPLKFDAVRDWGRLVRLGSDENALVALGDRVRHLQNSGVPLEIERQLAILALDRQFRMRLLQERLEQSIGALNAAGIVPLLLKGSALAYTVYGSFVARPMRDIDLLIGPERADEARGAMLDLGWMCDPELPGDRSYDAHHHFPPLRDTTAGGLRLEVHRALLPMGHPFHFTEDEIWRASRRVQVGTGHALVMHPSHHAVHIAIHFAWAHMLNLGAWHAFRDLAALRAAGMLDWGDFVRTALEWRASTCCYWTLRLGRSLSGLEVPDEVLSELRPALPESLRRPLARHFVRGLARGKSSCPSMRLSRALWSLAMQPRRNGHGRIRPWLVSLDLLSALEDSAGASTGQVPESALLQIRRSSRYLSEILV